MLSEVSHLQWKATLKPGHLYRLGMVFEMQTVDSYNLLVYLCPLSAFGMLFYGIVTHFSVTVYIQQEQSYDGSRVV